MPRPERRLHGVAGADGIVIGPAHVLREIDAPIAGAGGPEEQAKAAVALQAVAARLGEASARLRAAGRVDEAEILETSQLMAEDPTLLAEVDAIASSRPAAAALLEATERQAEVLAAIPDPYLAARAADVRRLGRQAARLAIAADTMGAGAMGAGAINCAPTASDPVGAQFIAPDTTAPDTTAPAIVVAQDLGPTDFAEIELDGLVIGGIALAEGSVTSHAAIVARSLGIPLVVGLGPSVMALPDGMPIALDGIAGTLVISPLDTTLREAQVTISARQRREARLARSRDRAAATADGHRIRLLVNASTERELLAGLAAGAEGIGLLRTELAFLDAADWPTATQHEAAVRPILQHLAGRPAAVRTLDFGADKTPPFLRGRAERGVALQLATPDALAAQLRGLLQAASATRMGTRLRIMLPLVERAEQLEAARQVLHAARQETGLGTPPPSLGAMIETGRAVEQIDAIAAAADFLSIGTNDLVQDLIGLDRLTPAATVRSAADPCILRAIGTVTAAARHQRISVDVCGEAAGDPRIAVLLLGLGVSELSVAPSRLDEVRAAIQAVTSTQAMTLAETAFALTSADAVLALVDSDEPG